MKFTADQKRWLRAEGVSRQLIYNWQNGQGVGKRHIRLVAKVLGLKDPLDLIDPLPDNEPEKGEE